MSDGPSISFEQEGPIIVTGLDRFTNSRGESIRTRPEMRLCRCGESTRKPFCDDTHKGTGFTDAKETDRVADALERFEGADVTVRDNRGICSHAGYCTSGLPSVWSGSREPWIDPDGAPADAIIDTIKRCPSGALAWERDGDVVTGWHDEPEVHVSRNGPYWVRGSIQIDGEIAEGHGGDHYALCRCGHSRNKPFCDGTHWYAGFADDEGRTISKAARAAADVAPEWVPVGSANDFPVGEVRGVTVGPRRFAVVRTTAGLFALEGACPHQGGPLTEGTLCDGAIRCPWHGYDFAVDTGAGVGNTLRAETIEIREADGSVEVKAPKPKRSNWTVSHVIAETLVNWGVDTVFGMVGHSNLGMAEALRIQEERGALRYVGIRHEGAAAFACSGYAKASGKPAACLSIAGPGATNLLTGLWDAKVDRAPVLALTGQVQTQVMGPGHFQDIDLANAFHAVARFSKPMLHDSRHAELVALALKTAIIERDVAHLILPDEVQTLDAGEQAPAHPDGRISQTAIAAPPRAIDYANLRIGRAKRPVIIVGYGAREGMDQVIALAERLRCPVITTFKAKGQISDAHPLGAGVLGRSGTPVASWFMNQADLLIVFGASFSDHTGITASKPTIQVDFDRMQLGKFHPVDELVWGDIRRSARAMLEALPQETHHVDQREELAERWAAWRREKIQRQAQDRGEGINSATIFAHLSEVVPDDAVIAVDVGNNTYSFGRYFECASQRVLMSGYLGSIGFAFPAAMGAWAAVGDRHPIVSISGDGGFGQYMGEFNTAVKYAMSLTHVLLNNAELGKISKEQRDGEWEVWQTGLRNPNFAEYATLCGGHGRRVDDPSDLRSALEEALAVDGPSLVEIMADPLLT